MAEFDVNLNQQGIDTSPETQDTEALEAQRLAQLESERQAQLASNLRGENETATEDTFTAEDKRDEQAITQGNKKTYIAENGDEVIETYVENVLVEQITKHIEGDGKVVEIVISYANGKPTKKVVKEADVETTELYEDEQLTEKVIRQTDDNNNVIESTISYQNGRPTKKVEKENGNTVSTSTYEEKVSEDGSTVVVVTKESPDRTKTQITVSETDNNGDINSLDIISKTIEKPNGEKESFYKTEEGNVAHKIEKPGEPIITEIYDSDKIYFCELANELPFSGLNVIYQSAEIDGKLYEVQYDGNGHTITFAKDDDNISTLCEKFHMTEAEFRELNPEITENSIKALDRIVVDGIYEATSPEIKNQGTRQETYQKYCKSVTESNELIQTLYGKQAGRLDRSYFESEKRPAFDELFEYFDIDKNGAIETRYSNAKKNEEIQRLIGVVQSLAFSLDGENFNENGLSLDEAENVIKELGLRNVSGQDLLDFCAIAVRELKPLKTDEPFKIVKNLDGTYRVYTYYQDGTVGTELFDKNDNLLSFAMPTTNTKSYSDDYGNYITPRIDIDGHTISGNNNLFISAQQHMNNVEYAQNKLFYENEDIQKTIDAFFDDAGGFTKAAMWLSNSDEDLEKIKEVAKNFKDAIYFQKNPLETCDRAALQDYVTYSNMFAKVTEYRSLVERIKLAEKSPFNEKDSYEQVYQLYLTLTGNEEDSKDLAQGLIDKMKPCLEKILNKYIVDNDAVAVFSKGPSGIQMITDLARDHLQDNINEEWNKIVEEAFADFKRDATEKYKQSFQISQMDSNNSTWIKWSELDGIAIKDGETLSDEEAEQHYEKLKSLFGSSYQAAFGKENPILKVMNEIEANQQFSECLKLFAEILAGTILLLFAPESIGFAAHGFLSMGAFTAAGGGLDVLDAVTSDNGLSKEKFGKIVQSRHDNLPMLAFGSFAAGPAAMKVGQFFSKLGLESAVTAVSKGGSFSVRELMSAVAENNKLLSMGASFMTETAAFTGYEMVTTGASLEDAFKNNIGMMGMMRAYGYGAGILTGQMFKAAKLRTRLNTAAEKSGINKWRIAGEKGRYTLYDENNSLIGQFSSVSEISTYVTNRIGQYVSFDKEADKIYKKAEVVNGQKIYEEVYGNKVTESKFLNDLKVKKINEGGETKYSAEINGKEVTFNSFEEVVDRCNYEISLEKYSKLTNDLFESNPQVTGKDVFKALNENMPETELPYLENTIIEKSGDGFVLKINGQEIRVKNNIELTQVLNNIANLDAVNVKMTEFFANSPESTAVSFNSFQRKMRNECGLKNIVADDIAKKITIRKVVDGDKVKYELSYDNGEKIYASDISEIIDISRRMEARPDEFKKITTTPEPNMEEADEPRTYEFSNKTIHFNDGKTYKVGPNDNVVVDPSGNIHIQVSGKGDYIVIGHVNNIDELQYNEGAKKAVNKGVTNTSVHPDGAVMETKVFTEKQIAEMKAKGEIISVKDDGSVYRFNPATKQNELLGKKESATTEDNKGVTKASTNEGTISDKGTVVDGTTDEGTKPKDLQTELKKLNVPDDVIEDIIEENPQKIDEIISLFTSYPNVTEYFRVFEIVDHPEKIKLLCEHEELILSFQEFDSRKIKGFLDSVDYKYIKDGLSILKDVPEDVKTKFKDSLGQIYIINVANKSGLCNFRPESFIETYKKCLGYEDAVAKRLLDIVKRDITELDTFEPSNLDVAANYLKSEPRTNRNFVIKILSGSKDISKNEAILNDLLENKDEILKQVTMRCKNTNPEFVKYVEEYLNSRAVRNLLFMPNLSMNTLANNFFEVSKIFHYVDTKPQDFINGHYSDEIINALKEYRQKDSDKTLFNNLSEADKSTVQHIDMLIHLHINENFEQILDAISSTDIETVKLLLDKRFSIFNDKIQEINDLSGATKTILADVIRNGKRINKNGQPDKLTGQQKIDMINLIKCTTIIDDFDINNYKTPLKKGAFVLDSKKLHDDILKAILTKRGLSQEEIDNLSPDKQNWNEKYLSLLYRTPGRDEGELSDVIKGASMGDFNEFISDTNNKYGKTNLKTRQAFESNGLNYEQWLRPDVTDVEFEVAGKQCHIKIWDRNPQEDMFLGSKTNCCTALDRTNGGSMAIYMLNTSYNVVELYNAKGEVVGMSRVFMVNADGKPTLIMDNIELNHEFTKGMNFDTDIKDIRDNFFKYMNNYAEKITGNPDTQVLFYSGDIHVPNKDLTKVDKPIDFIGNIHREEVYINSVRCSYYNPDKLEDVGNITWLKVPKE